MPLDLTAHSNGRVLVRSWMPGPQDPELRRGEVDVWRVDLAGVSDHLLAHLSAGEHARAERMSRFRDPTPWARARAVLRELLSRYLQAEPRALVLGADDRGKPVLGALATHATNLYFNLSHSGETALYAFSNTAPLGIDVEVPRRHIDALAIAARAFGAGEVDRLRKLDQKAREREFLRAWVRHEAAMKCRGAGVWDDAKVAAESRPWITELDLSGRGYAALAVGHAPADVHCWDWLIQTGR